MRFGTFFFLGALLFSLPSMAAPPALTYQGRILKSDGTPLEYSNVGFIFQITDPTGSCVIYEEQVSGFDMSNSGGVFDTAIGSGSRSFPVLGTSTVLDSFSNAALLNCEGGSTYLPSIDDGRKLRVRFSDGTGWKLVSPDNVIRSVPYAGYAASSAKLGTNVATDFVLKTAINSGATCDGGNFLTWNASTLSFGCSAVSGAGGGTLTGITSANSYLSVSNTDPAIPALTVNVGTAANTLAAGNDSRIVNAMQTGASAGGDLSGTYPNPSVAKINNVGLSFSSIASGQFLKYNGTSWINATIAQSDVSGLSTTLSGYMTTSAFSADVASAACSTSQTMYWSSVTSAFACQSISVANFSGALAGDVSGTQGATSVDKIKGVGLDFSTAPVLGKVLKYNGTNWAPADDVDSASTATSSNTASTIVKRDSSGNFAAGTITASVTGASSLNVLKAGDSMSGNLTFAATKGDVFTAGSGANTVSLQGPSSAIGTSYVLRLPTSQSSGTQALVNDGSGNLSWQSLSAGSMTSITATSPLSSTGGTTPTLSLAGLSTLGTANQILGMNSGATGYEYKTVNGTTNQITVTNAANSITLSTPQNIHVGASPTFAGMTLSGMTTAGLVKNTVSGVLSGGNSITLSTDVAGTLPIANGGTGSGSFAGYSVIASNSSGSALTAVAGSVSGSVLQYSATGPIFSTASYPSTTAANQLLYSSSANVVGGLATANSSILATNSSGVPSFQSLSGDIFSQYALLAGRSGGQTLNGGTAASNTLTLAGTSNGTAGYIILNSAGGNVGIGTTAPIHKLTNQSSNITDASGIGESGSNVFTWTHPEDGNFGYATAIYNSGTTTGNGALLLKTANSTASEVLLRGSSGGVDRFTFRADGNVGIGTTAPATTALLDISSTTHGFLPPRMTTTQRDAITSPATGLLIYNSSQSQLNYYNGSSWSAIIGGSAAAAVPSFNVNASTGQSLASGWQKLTWDIENFDTNSNFASSRFTPTVAGKYLLASTFRTNASTTSTTAVGIYKNGTLLNYATGEGSSVPSSSISMIVDANGTTDYFEVYGYTNLATNVYAFATSNVFSGTLISPVTVSSGGSGTANYVPVWSSATTLGNSPIAISGSNVGIGTTTPGQKLTVAGTIESTSGGIKFPDGTIQASAQGSAYYYGQTTTTSLTWPATTWTDVTSVVTLADVLTSNITRSASTFTFATTGIYRVNISFNGYGTSVYAGLRLRKTNGTAATLIQRTGFGSNDTTNGGETNFTLSGLISVTAGDIVNLQYVVKNGTSSTWGSQNPLDGETMVTGDVTIEKIK